MQLDKTQITVRERSYPEILDLALIVLRRQGTWILMVLFLGTAPLAIAQYLLLRDWLAAAELTLNFEDGAERMASQPWDYGFAYVALSIWLMPLATAPLTIALGQTLFLERPVLRQVFRDFVRMLPQLLWYQTFIRGLVSLLPILGWAIWFSRWPFLSEIILLERNPWRKSRQHPISTNSRNADMHGHNGGDLFGRWISTLCIGSILVIAIWSSIYYLRGMLVANIKPDWTTYAIDFPIALWLTIGFLTVARFLSYLDQRIRGEGWEIELSMRAEADRLTRQFT